ncbi:MAG: hypothetical protein WDM96_08510 [Lacunisphaera sp.]
MSSKKIPLRGPLNPDQLRRIDAWWRAANYLSSAKSISSTIRCCESRSSART